MPVLPLIVLSIFYAVGLFLLGSGIKALRQAMAAKNWSTTPGTVEDVSFVTDNDSDSTEYRVDIKYWYEVEGARYDGSNLSFGYDTGRRRAPQQKLYEKLKSARKIEVRFNPKEPSQSTLTYGANRSHIKTFTAAAACLLVPIGFIAVFFLLFFGRNEARLLNRLVVLE